MHATPLSSNTNYHAHHPPPIPTPSRTNIPSLFRHHPTFHAWLPPSPISPITFSLSSCHTHPSPTCAEPGRLGCPPCPRPARLHRNPQSCPSTLLCPMHASRPIPHFFCCVRDANKAPAPHPAAPGAQPLTPPPHMTRVSSLRRSRRLHLQRSCPGSLEPPSFPSPPRCISSRRRQ